jgi:hypothetical protein
MTMPTEIEKDVYAPLAYFAYFGYPLTAFEVWKWLYRPSRSYTLEEVEDVLESSTWLKKHVSIRENFYAIGDPKKVRVQVLERKRRYNDAIIKERKLKWVLRFLRRLPGVKGVAICNTLPLHFTRKEGDIDLFVITAPGKIWSVRFSIVAPFALLSQRPGEARKHALDASFFVTTNGMGLSSLRMEDDPYFAYWMATLTPVLGSEKLWNTFFKANTWVKEVLPNAGIVERAYRVARQEMAPLPIWLPNQFMKHWQTQRLPKDLKEQANTSTRVVMTDDVLKFHRTDRRAEIAEEFHNQLEVCDNE